MEVRFRLNNNNIKDKVIIDFLGGEYSPAETIKALMYKMATGNTKGTALSFWGNVSTVNVAGKSETLPLNDDNSNLEDNNEMNKNPTVDQERETALAINDDFKKFFK